MANNVRPFIGLAWLVPCLMLLGCQPTEPTTPEPQWLADSRGPQWPADHFFMQRSWPDGQFDLKRYAQGLADARAQADAKDESPGFDLNWTVRGPGNLGGRINTIAVHPSNNNLVLLGFSRGGVWRTTNGGQNWSPIFDDQLFTSIGDLAFDPFNPQVIYAGTGDPNISGFPAVGDGLWRSPDGGLSWQRRWPNEYDIISRVLVNPTNPNILLVGSMGIPFVPTNQRGLYRSTDAGVTWQQVLFVSEQAGIIDMVQHPDNPNVVFAASWDRLRSNSVSFVSGPNARIYRSLDAGLTWAPLANGLPQDEQGRIGLYIAPSNPQHIYAMYVGTNSQLYDIFESTDGGDSWSSVLDPAAASPLSGGELGGFGWYFGKIRVSPTDENDLWLLGVDLWRSRDGGANWEEACPPWWTYEVHADKHDLTFDAQGRIYLATDGGLYRSDNDAASWEDAENIPTNQTYRVAVDGFQPTKVFGGFQDNGSSGGDQLGEEWPRIFGGDGFQMAFRPDMPDVFYAETQNGGIVGTDDGGFNWFDATQGINSDDRVNWDAPYFISSHNPDVLYTATDRVYRSENGIIPEFEAISDDLTDGVVIHPRFHTISAICESPLDPRVLYAGTADGNVWQGDAVTGLWQPVYAGLPDRYVTSVKASPSEINRVFVTLSGYRDNDFVPHLFRSDNGGANWSLLAGDLPNLSLNDVYILPGHQDSILFVATDGGVYGSRNGGINWERLGKNMTYVPVYDLEWNPVTNELVAGTFGRSIQTYPLDSLLSTGPVVSVNGPDAPVQRPYVGVSPNPARGAAWLSWSQWTGTQYPLLEVYAADGRRVLTQQLGATAGQTQVSLSGWPAGVYYWRVSASGRSQVAKMLVTP